MSVAAIRPARTDDLDEVLAFFGRAAEGTSISDDRRGLEALLERDPEALLIAEVGGRIAGTVIAGWDGWRCHLYRLAVEPALRRRGIGTALLRAAERRFLDVGGRRADAMVLEDNPVAHTTWAHAGYAPQRQWTRWVRFLPHGRRAPTTD